MTEGSHAAFTFADARTNAVAKRILVEWNGPENPSAVEWTFEYKGDNTTFVLVKNWGFNGSADRVVAEAVDSTGAEFWVTKGASPVT